jgi:hypothetical protein
VLVGLAMLLAAGTRDGRGLVGVGNTLPVNIILAPAKVSQRTLTFVERVAYQRAIEDVYWRHRI